jgi:hypothetical protein
MSQAVLERRGQSKFVELLEMSSNRREQLLASEKFSLPSTYGQLSIIVSGARGKIKNEQLSQEEQYDRFIEEAERIKEKRERAGLYAGIVIRPRGTVEQIEADFGSPEISDIMFVGHGCISRIWTEKSNGIRDYNWSRAAQATTHLKQGKIEQGMCGHFPRIQETSVPLGTFTVARLSSVEAAPGAILPIPDGSPREHFFAPLFNDNDNAIEQIHALNDQYRGVLNRMDLVQPL